MISTSSSLRVKGESDKMIVMRKQRAVRCDVPHVRIMGAKWSLENIGTAVPPPWLSRFP